MKEEEFTPTFTHATERDIDVLLVEELKTSQEFLTWLAARLGWHGTISQHSMKALAEQFVEDGLFGDIPANIQNYLDYDAIAYDLSMDYSEAIIDGTCYIYRMA